MKKYLTLLAQYTGAALLTIIILLYFSSIDHQDVTLLVLMTLIYLNTIAFKINYRKLLQVSTALIVLATACKILLMAVLASQLLVLAFIIFAISVLKLILSMTYAVYGKTISHWMVKL